MVQLSYRQVCLLSIPSGVGRCFLRLIRSASAVQMVIFLTQAPYGMVGVFPTWHNGKCAPKELIYCRGVSYMVQLSYRQVYLLIPNDAGRCFFRQIQSTSAAQTVICFFVFFGTDTLWYGSCFSYLAQRAVKLSQLTDHSTTSYFYKFSYQLLYIFIIIK